MTTPDEVVQYARSWMGTRWIHQGRSPLGIDCVGLLVMIVNEFGLDGKGTDMLGYRRTADVRFLRHIKKHSDPVRPLRPVHGAVGIFNDTNMPCHVGVFAVDSDTGTVTVIHAEAFPAQRVHEQLFDEGNMPMSGRVVDIRYFRGVDYV